MFCTSMCTMCVYDVHTVQKCELNSYELELWRTVSHHVGTENRVIDKPIKMSFQDILETSNFMQSIYTYLVIIHFTILFCKHDLLVHQIKYDYFHELVCSDKVMINWHCDFSYLRYFSTKSVYNKKMTIKISDYAFTLVSYKISFIFKFNIVRS